MPNYLKRLSIITAVIFLALAFTRQAQAALKPGDLAMDFKLQDLNQGTVSLSDYKGKPVLLFFWTTWCPFCRTGLKELLKLQPELKQKQLQLLTLNAGEPAEKVKSFAQSFGLNFTVLLDKGLTVSEAYDVLGVPTYVLIDKNGLIIFADHYFPKDMLEEFTPQQNG